MNKFNIVFDLDWKWIILGCCVFKFGGECQLSKF